MGLKFASLVLYIFFSFKVRKDSVEEKESCLAAGNRATQAGQIMQLTKSAGERRFSALIGARYYNDSLLVLQLKIIADNRQLFAHEPMGKG